MVKLVQGTEAEASSHQPKRRGREAKFTPAERRARKRACDNKRYHKTQATLRQIKFLKKTNANLAFENRRLKSRIAAVARVVRATNANLKLVKDRLMNMDNRIEKFLRGELEENDLMSLEIPLDNVYLGGEDTLREIGEMKTQLKVLEEEMLKQIGNVKGDIEVVKNDFKKMESLPEKFLQKELTDDDLMSLEIPLDNDFLGGEV
ncbi:hypothetical protein SLEP1_g18581 [Rubroshorea leprosula]|uniref:BZIP domain-containing protein n=1 Tax=Rubroshorea leprosula TaxID=152421 RepID=A0AAV5J3U3_9ROSI|nr:hypothetical protein SLEP1_g18581 [Rubroshorea leprosula]